MRFAAIVIAVAGCRDAEPRVAPELGDYLFKLSGRDEPTRATAVGAWRMSGDEWDRVVVEPYRAVYDDYVKEFEAARPTFVTQLAQPHSIVTRAHFAADPTATRSQAITRWALPTLAAARLAELAGRPPAPIDAVFVDVGGQWRAIVGLGAIVRRRVAALDVACATAIDNIEPGGGRCIEAAWAVAHAALREDRPRFAHACGLAANLCGKPSP